MSRKPMITRTIVTTKVTILAMDLVNRQPIEKEVVLPRTYKDDKALMKVLTKTFDNEEFKVTAILNKEEQSDIYGMSEQEFISRAVKLDTDRKMIEEDSEEQ